MPNYVRLDFRDVQAALGAHYDPSMRDEYTGVCSECQEEVPQTVNECPVCGLPVVWFNSKAWKALYGSPDAYVRLLSMVEPEDEAGRELCRLAGVAGFANQTEAQRWARAARKLGQARLRGIVKWVQGKGRKGRGMMAHALNLAEKIAREEKPKKAVDAPLVGVQPGDDEIIF